MDELAVDVFTFDCCSGTAERIRSFRDRLWERVVDDDNLAF